MLPVIPESVNAYSGNGQIIFLLNRKTSTGQVLVLHGKVSKNVVTTQVPVLSAGGLNIVITSLKLTVKTIGSGSKAFITAGKCSSGKFTVKSNFTYQTGATMALSELLQMQQVR